MATLQNVADLAGVSTATVSRTLNNPEQVDPVTRSKVSDAIRQSGYKRNETARSLAMQSSRTIGLLTDAFMSTYHAPILDYTTRFLHEHGYYTLVESIGATPTYSNVGILQSAWQSLIGRQVESLIFLSSFISDEQLTNMLNDFPPSVVIGRPVENAEERCVFVDHYTGGKVAAKHLLEKGHQRIAMITGPESMKDANERGRGFKDELEANGIKLEPTSVFVGNFTVKSGMDAARSILQSQLEFSAVFAQNDDMAAGAISEFHAAGIDIPEQLSIVGFDNSTMATAVYPQLTSIEQPLKEMSRSAATLALNLSKGRAKVTPLPSPQLTFSPTLVERNSVAEKQIRVPN